MNNKTAHDRAVALIETLWNKATDNLDGECEGCGHYVCTTEHHPYGMGMAPERLCECTVSNQNDCPAVEQILSEALAIVSIKVKEG